MTSREQAAQARAAQATARADRPSQRRLGEDPASRQACRVQLDVQDVREVTRNGLTVVRVGGYASVTEAPYEMWDWAGPYSEVVSAGAFGKTLAAGPMVEFTLNHGAGGGLPMAHTRNDTLTLAEDTTGLAYEAFVDPKRTDVANMLKALERGDLSEASFKFRIDSGQWSPDYTEYRITQVDLHRGDVSAVNFGANPAASSGLRAAQRPASVRADVEGVHPVTPRQMALYQAFEAVAETHGKFDQGTGPDGAHYLPASPFAGEGMACSNCVMFEGPRACEVVDGDIAPEGVCKLWVIPADLMTGDTAAPQRAAGLLEARLALAIARS